MDGKPLLSLIVFASVVQKENAMRSFGLVSWVLAACCLAGAATVGTPTLSFRYLSSLESHKKSAGTFYYCASTVNMGSTCDQCTLSIHWEWMPSPMPGAPPYLINDYQKCTAVLKGACAVGPWGGSPSPTCDLNPATCAGNTTLFFDSGCTMPAATTPFEPCSMFYNTYIKSTGGFATGVDCTTTPSPPVLKLN